MLRGIRDEGDVTRKFMEARCDRGAEIARMLFLSEQTAGAIRSLDEHWDGRGMPDGLRGEEIPLAARILCLAQTVQAFARVIDAKSPFTAELADLAANHHEKLDGSGYPRSLDAGDLDLPMRVLAVADIYEALTADRPYRAPLPPQEALGMIARDAPDKLDPDALGALEAHLAGSARAGVAVLDA
ncbi:MAG: HD domain-containing phosphohydrolase [Solirubrobacteraceae bacterium]